MENFSSLRRAGRGGGRGGGQEISLAENRGLRILDAPTETTPLRIVHIDIYIERGTVGVESAEDKTGDAQ